MLEKVSQVRSSPVRADADSDSGDANHFRESDRQLRGRLVPEVQSRDGQDVDAENDEGGHDDDADVNFPEPLGSHC